MVVYAASNNAFAELGRVEAMKRMLLCAAVLVLAGPAAAGKVGPDDPGDTDGSGPCYETVGCVQDRRINESDAEQLGCDQLWTVRNGIYAARGYCFKTDRGKQAFGNEGCYYGDESEVPLNDYERANVLLIRSIEKRRGC